MRESKRIRERIGGVQKDAVIALKECPQMKLHINIALVPMALSL